MNAAPCSCRVSTKRMLSDASSDIMKSAFSSPGTPKMYSMPSASRHLTNRSDAFMGLPMCWLLGKEIGSPEYAFVPPVRMGVADVGQMGHPLRKAVVAGSATEQGGKPAGMPFMRYFSMDGHTMRAAAGMPVHAPLAGSGDIEPHILPGGRALTATHLGDYQGVGMAWQRVWDRARELGVEVRFGGWDVYANDPESVAPAEIETRIYLPLSS